MAVNDNQPDACGVAKHLDAAVDLLAGLVLDAFLRDPAGLCERAARRVIAELEALQDAEADAYEQDDGAMELLAGRLGIGPSNMVSLACQRKGSTT